MPYQRPTCELSPGRALVVGDRHPARGRRDVGDLIDLFTKEVISTRKGPIEVEELDELLSDLYAEFGNLFELTDEDDFWDALRNLKARFHAIPMKRRRRRT